MTSLRPSHFYFSFFFFFSSFYFCSLSLSILFSLIWFRPKQCNRSKHEHLTSVSIFVSSFKMKILNVFYNFFFREMKQFLTVLIYYLYIYFEMHLIKEENQKFCYTIFFIDVCLIDEWNHFIIWLTLLNFLNR